MLCKHERTLPSDTDSQNDPLFHHDQEWCPQNPTKQQDHKPTVKRSLKVGNDHKIQIQGFMCDFCWKWTNFNLESSFEATGKESTKWSDQRGERRERNTVDLKWVKVHRFLQTQERRRHQYQQILHCYKTTLSIIIY